MPHLRRAIVLCSLGLAPWTTPFPSPAAEIWLQVEGVPGEAVQRAHIDWIDLKDFRWEISRGESAHARFSPLYVTKTLDRSSPKLTKLCASLRPVPRLVLHFSKGLENQVVLYEMTMEDVVVTQATTGGGSGPSNLRPVEEYGFTFQRVEWTVHQFDAKGGKVADHTAYWDLAKGSGEAGSSLPTVLRIRGDAAGNWVVSWYAAPGTRYLLQASSTVERNYITVADVAAGQGGPVERSFPNSPHLRFFKLQVGP